MPVLPDVPNQLATFARSFTAFESFCTFAPSHEPLASPPNCVDSVVSASLRAEPDAFSADDSAERAAEICEVVHQPVLRELARRGIPFRGVLYAGLMMTADGFSVLEFNVRFGDPETQAILPRLHTDLLELFELALVPGGLSGVTLEWTPDTAVTLVLASRGYPASSSSGDRITGLDRVPDDVWVTHAGTARGPDGSFVTAGGRVLGVTALGADAAAARDSAYAAADMIEFDGKQMRRDIALRAVRA